MATSSATPVGPAACHRLAAGLDRQARCPGHVGRGVDVGAAVGGDAAGGDVVRDGRVRRRAVLADRLGLERVGHPVDLRAVAQLRDRRRSIADLNGSAVTCLPSGATNTTLASPVSAIRPGNRSCISSMVCCDSVPGIEKSSSGAEGAFSPAKIEPARIAIQARPTHARRLKANRPIRANNVATGVSISEFVETPRSRLRPGRVVVQVTALRYSIRTRWSRCELLRPQ